MWTSAAVVRCLWVTLLIQAVAFAEEVEDGADVEQTSLTKVVENEDSPVVGDVVRAKRQNIERGRPLSDSVSRGSRNFRLSPNTRGPSGISLSPAFISTINQILARPPQLGRLTNVQTSVSRNAPQAQPSRQQFLNQQAPRQRPQSSLQSSRIVQSSGGSSQPQSGRQTTRISSRIQARQPTFTSTSARTSSGQSSESSVGRNFRQPSANSLGSRPSRFQGSSNFQTSRGRVQTTQRTPSGSRPQPGISRSGAVLVLRSQQQAPGITTSRTSVGPSPSPRRPGSSSQLSTGGRTTQNLRSTPTRQRRPLTGSRTLGSLTGLFADSIEDSNEVTFRVRSSSSARPLPAPVQNSLGAVRRQPSFVLRDSLENDDSGEVIIRGRGRSLQNRIGASLRDSRELRDSDEFTIRVRSPTPVQPLPRAAGQSSIRTVVRDSIELEDSREITFRVQSPAPVPPPQRQVQSSLRANRGQPTLILRDSQETDDSPEVTLNISPRAPAPLPPPRRSIQRNSGSARGQANLLVRDSLEDSPELLVLERGVLLPTFPRVRTTSPTERSLRVRLREDIDDTRETVEFDLDLDIDSEENGLEVFDD